MKKIVKMLGLLALLAASVFAASCKNAADSDGGSPRNDGRTSNVPTEFTISYKANGGSGAISAQTVGIGDEATLSDGEGLSKDGDFFAGWNTDKNGDGDSYEAGAKVVLSDDLTLYAQWLPQAAKDAFEAVKFGEGDDNPAEFSDEVTLSGADNWTLNDDCDWCELVDASPSGFMASAQPNKTLKLKSGVPSVTIIPRKATLTAKFTADGKEYSKKFTVRQKFAEYVNGKETWRFDGEHLTHIEERKDDGQADFHIDDGEIYSYTVSGGTLTVQLEKRYNHPEDDEPLFAFKSGWYDKAGERKLHEEYIKKYPEKNMTMADIDKMLASDFGKFSFNFTIKARPEYDDWVEVTQSYDSSKEWWEQEFFGRVESSYQDDMRGNRNYIFSISILRDNKDSMPNIRIITEDDGRKMPYYISDFKSTGETWTFKGTRNGDDVSSHGHVFYFKATFDNSTKKLTVEQTDADTAAGKEWNGKKGVFNLGAGISGWIDEVLDD